MFQNDEAMFAKQGALILNNNLYLNPISAFDSLQKPSTKTKEKFNVTTNLKP
jgi:hypothetical protein